MNCIIKSCGKCVFDFVRICSLFSKRVVSLYTCPTFLSKLGIVSVLDSASLVDTQWFAIVGSVCVSMMANDVDRLFV